MIGLGTYAAITMRISQKVYLYHKMTQWLMSWLRSLLHHQLMMFFEQNVWVGNRRSKSHPVVLAFLFCISVLHKRAVHFLPAHIDHKACVSSQMSGVWWAMGVHNHTE